MHECVVSEYIVARGAALKLVCPYVCVWLATTVYETESAGIYKGMHV